MNNFVHLHCHDQYSSLDGVAKTSELVKLAKDHGNPGIAITNHGNMNGIFSAWKECKKNNIKLIGGCEYYTNENIGQVGEDGKRLDRSGNHCIILFKDQQGYKNACKLNYLSFTYGYYYRPKICRKWIFENKKGLIITTSCMAHEINRLFIDEKDEEAYKVIEEYKKELNDDFYIEIQINEIPNQKIINRKLIEAAKNFNIKMVLTADVHYPYKDDAKLQDLLIHINRGTNVNTKEEDKFFFHARNLYMLQQEDFYHHNNIWNYNYDQSFIDSCLENTLEIVDKSNFDFETGKINFPVFGVDNSQEYLRQLAKEKFQEFQDKNIIPYKNHNLDEYIKRLEYELDSICNNNYADYFLILWDLCDYAKKNKISKGSSRGSSASSLIAYILGITTIDPIRFGLFFERFMGGSSKEDVRTPDIDMDWDSDRKDELEQYLVDKYGKDRVIHVVTNSCFHIKGVLRDLTRAFDRNKQEVDFVTKNIEDNVDNIAEYFENIRNKIICKEPEHISRDEKRMFDWISGNLDLIYYANRLNGQLRHYSKHACAIVITPGPVYDYMPINKVQGVIVSGFQESSDLKELKELGLLKLDLLGLNNVSIVDRAIETIKRTRGIDISKDVLDIDLENKELYNEFSKGKNDFIFQFSGDGINNLIKQVKPDCFEDVCAINSLYRPATLNSGTAWKYAKCKNNEKERIYIHEKLKPILDPTYSIITYQEQVLMIAHDLAGFSWADSDKTRKILENWQSIDDKKKDEFTKKFIDGCIKNGIDEQTSKKIIDWLQEHTGYSFNRAHSAGYSYLAMQTQFLKMYYPLEFYSVVLSRTGASKGNIGPMLEAINSIKNNGIEILPFDINNSKDYFNIEENKLRISFNLIDGLGGKSMAQLIKNQPYSSIYDFCKKNIKKGSQINKTNVENLIKVGAFSSFEKNWAKVDAIISLYQSDQKKFESDENYFNQTIEQILLQVDITDFNDLQKMQFEEDIIGCNIFHSPFLINNRDKMIIELYKKGIIKKLDEIDDSGASLVLIESIKKIKDKKQRDMAFLKVKDFTGNSSDVVVFSSNYQYISDKLGKDVYLMFVNRSEKGFLFGPKGWNVEKNDVLNSLIPIDSLL